MIELYNPFPIFTGAVEHLPDVSCYNHNYYRLNGTLTNYNEIDTTVENVILEECHEDDNFYSFELGHFDEDGEFDGVAWWDSDYGSDGIQDFIN